MNVEIGRHRGVDALQGRGGVHQPEDDIGAEFVSPVENELIVSHEDFDEEMAALFGSKRMTVRIEFINRGEQTLLRLTQGPYSGQFEPMARAGWRHCRPQRPRCPTTWRRAPNPSGRRASPSGRAVPSTGPTHRRRSSSSRSRAPARRARWQASAAWARHRGNSISLAH